MTVISKPEVTVNKLPAILPIGNAAQKVLVINQMLPAGTATPGVLYEAVQKNNIKTMFGEGSFLQNALTQIFDVFELSGSTILPQVDVIALEDAGAGTASTATLTITELGGATNEATESGTINVIVGSKKRYNAAIDVVIGQAITTGAGNISDAIADAINAFTELPVTAVNVAGVITLTCRHKGTIGNEITVKLEGLIKSGSDYVIGNVKFAPTLFSGGATDPVVTNTLDVVGDNRYQTLTHPEQYGTVFSVEDFLDNRFNVNNAIRDGVAIVCKVDTLANLKAYPALSNSQSLCVPGLKLIDEDVYKGSAPAEFSFNISAQLSAIRALRLTENANLIRFVASSVSPGDLEGGIHMASFPYFNTPLYLTATIDTGVGFTAQEISELTIAGITVIGNNVVGNEVILGDVVTTYKKDTQGNPDPTWHYLNVVDTLSVSAEYYFNNIKRDYAQSRLTQGNVNGTFTMTNDVIFKGRLVKYYIDLSDFALVPAGKEAVDFVTKNLIVAINMIEGKITATESFPIVVQLRNILVKLRTTFSIT